MGPGQSGMPSGFSEGGSPSMPTGGSEFNAGGNSGVTGTEGQMTETQPTKSESAYSIEESDIYEISPLDTMSIEISVDELDIRELSVGQKVTVTLDAIPGTSFDGEITEIASEGTYDTGNTKFAVTVCVPRNEQMLSGMNAGIRIELDDPSDLVVIPISALVEKNGKTYVYTIYNEEKDELDGLTEVVTGLSDGSSVQITSGLSEGGKVYYRYADSIEYTFVLPR